MTHPTPFERSNQNQTTDWASCIAFYETLARTFPQVLRFFPIGTSDNGLPLHAGVVSADGVFDREAIHAAGRPVFFNNNGIHPGEPEGIDACMALVRDFCTQPQRLAALGQTVFLFIPVYNVDGCLNRQATSRVNQLGPEEFGFRANGRNLDLNRDFIKCDSLAAQAFNRFFTAWDPDVMVDTHTSNGADYQYTMTLINTQTDKLGGALGSFLRDTMLPTIYADMTQRGWPTCPYVNPVKTTPDDGIEDFLEVPRFSTGYAALHHTIGFMPETHMLKPFADRYASMRALVESVLAFTVEHGSAIQALRRAARAPLAVCSLRPVLWRPDYSRPASFRFKGFAPIYGESQLGNYYRLAYDRNQPWERDIAWFNRCVTDVEVAAPRSYYIPQAWREVIERLQWNGVELEHLTVDRLLQGEAYTIDRVASRPLRRPSVPRQSAAWYPCHNRAGQSRRCAGAPGPAACPLCGGDVGATSARQLLPLGFLQRHSGEERTLLGLRVRGYGTGDAARRAGTGCSIFPVEDREPRTTVRPAGGAVFSLRQWPTPR